MDEDLCLALESVKREQDAYDLLRSRLPSTIHVTVDCGIVRFCDTANPSFFCDTIILEDGRVVPPRCSIYRIMDYNNVMPAIYDAIPFVENEIVFRWGM